MSEQNNFKVFMADQDREAVDKIVSQVMPFLKDATLNQIEMALEKCLTTIKLCAIIR